MLRNLWKFTNAPFVSRKSAKVEAISGAARLKRILNDNQIVVVDFSAEWCGPCHGIKPVLDRWARELESEVKFVEIDVDVDQELAQDAGVSAMPTFVLYKRAKVYKKIVGTDMKRLRKAIDGLLKDSR